MTARLSCFVSWCPSEILYDPSHTFSRRDKGAGPRGSRRLCCRSGAELQRLLAENAEVSAPELVVLNRADRAAEAVREAGQVLDEQLRPRLVGRVAVLRVGQHERMREVRVRAVDQRHVIAAQRL